MILRIIGFLLLMVSSAIAADWTIDYENSKLEFIGTQTGTEFNGAFRNFTATVQFDPEDLGNAVIDVTIDTASAKTGNPERDSILPGADWFDVANHPAAHFISSSVVYMENGYTAIGTLTMKGVSQGIHLPFNLRETNGVTEAVGGITVDRNEYGIGTGPLGPMVGNDVLIKFHLTATP